MSTNKGRREVRQFWWEKEQNFLSNNSGFSKCFANVAMWHTSICDGQKTANQFTYNFGNVTHVIQKNREYPWILGLTSVRGLEKPLEINKEDGNMAMLSLLWKNLPNFMTSQLVTWA